MRTNHPLKIVATISTPIAPGMVGRLPNIDSLLQWSLIHHTGGSTYPMRHTPIHELDHIPIPTAKATLGGYSIPRTTDAIAKIHGESQEFINRKFDSIVEPYIRSDLLKKINMSTGRYKASRRPIRLLHIDTIVWFAYCNRKDTLHLLKSIHNIGSYHKIGYGRVDRWEVDIIEPTDFTDTWPITMIEDGIPILMRRIPLDIAIDYYGWKPAYGSWLPPNWNHARQTEIANPC